MKKKVFKNGRMNEEKFYKLKKDLSRVRPDLNNTEIAELTGWSTSTIARVKECVAYEDYRTVLESEKTNFKARNTRKSRQTTLESVEPIEASKLTPSDVKEIKDHIDMRFSQLTKRLEEYRVFRFRSK